MKIKTMLEMGAKMPTKAHSSDAGFDLYIPDMGDGFEMSLNVNPNSYITIDTGVHMAIPEGYVGMIKSKSGLNVKYGIQCEGVVDAFYTGSIKVKAYNHSASPYTFHQGDKITQIVILPIPEVELEETDYLEDTDRGSNGFGSSGR